MASSKDETTVAEAHELSELLVRAADHAKADFQTVSEDLALPVPSARALVQIADAAPMGDLAERLGCDRSYVTGLARDLEARGLITRRPGHDQRVKLLELTDAGRTTRERLIAGLAEHSTITRLLTPTQRRSLRPLLELLAQGAAPAVCA